jgi:biotin synthase
LLGAEPDDGSLDRPAHAGPGSLPETRRSDDSVSLRAVNLSQRALQGPPLEAPELLTVLGDEIPLLPLLHEAHQARRARFGNRVQVHVLSNAQNARCPEDCGYCSQSSTSKAPLKPYALKSREVLLAEARAAHAAGAYRYCIVASGRGPSDRQIGELAEAVRGIKAEIPVQICVSVGLLDEPKARALKAAGVDRLNHNLNTSAAHYGEICSTHDYADRMRTLSAGRQAGLELCSGLIVGMGERDQDIVDVALELRALEVPSIPVNFLIPIEGNRVQSDGSLSPERALRVLCLFRLANPRAEIRIAGGREGHLGALQPLALYPANSLFVEGYLTTRGSSALATYGMIRDAGFVVERPDGSIVGWEELGLDERFRVEGSDDLLKPSVRRPLPSPAAR